MIAAEKTSRNMSNMPVSVLASRDAHLLIERAKPNDKRRMHVTGSFDAEDCHSAKD